MATMIIYDIAIKHKVINNLEKRGEALPSRQTAPWELI
jgi:hypothetical protein